MTPFQSIVDLLGHDMAGLLVIGLSLTATALSAFITYLAYRGYRRNDSRPMFYLAVGFAFITVLPFLVEHIAFTLIAVRLPVQTARVLIPSLRYGIQIVGLVFVLYSLYGAGGDSSGRAAATGHDND